MTPTTTASWRGLGILGVATLALVTLASGAMAQSPAPVASPATGIASPQPSAATEGGRRIDICRRVRERGAWRFGRGERRGLRQRDLRRAFREPRRGTDDRAGGQRRLVGPQGIRRVARIAAVGVIEGTTVTFVTPDGWSRTLDMAGIPVTRGGEDITVSDLRVGDQVRVAQRRADDGTWQVARIRVLLTTLRGTVASVTADGFAITTRDGGSVQVRVSDATTWVLGCRTDPDAPLEVGARVVARGVSAADGSLDATVVAAAGPPLRRHRRAQEPPGPVASPVPAASPAA
ncbi:MAG: DUF5666 domain-containing protein [Candidatus Limnocylindrales bacterium]